MGTQRPSLESLALLKEWASECPIDTLDGHDRWAARDALTLLVGIFEHGTIAAHRPEWNGHPPEQLVIMHFEEEAVNSPHCCRFDQADVINWLIGFNVDYDYAKTVVYKMIESGVLERRGRKIYYSNGPFPPAQRTRFEAIYRRHLERLAQAFSWQWYAKALSEVERDAAIDDVVERFMAAAAASGNFSKDGPACSATCKELGIKSTYTAIRLYIES